MMLVHHEPLVLKPITLRQANAHVLEYHSHHPVARGCNFCIGCVRGGALVGVVIVERPKSRMLDDGYTLELSRVCTDRTSHVASKLIAAATRAAFAMGARRVISYILETEPGTSYRAAGWELVEKDIGGGAWSRTSRPRREPMADLLGLAPKAPECRKHRWEKSA